MTSRRSFLKTAIAALIMQWIDIPELKIEETFDIHSQFEFYLYGESEIKSYIPLRIEEFRGWIGSES